MFSSNLSNIAEGVNTAFIVILIIIFILLIGLTAVLIYFIIRYRESRNPVASQFHGNTTLEIVWTVIPVFLVLAMFWFGWTGWKPIDSKPPKNALHIQTTARMWKWDFKYDNGKTLDTLIIPVGKPVALNLTSADVIHSFYIPAFRFKKDVVPGRDRQIWFIANSPGVYDIFCAEYCGLEHSSMITAVKVLTEQDFDIWYGDTSTTVLVAAKSASPADIGKEIVRRIGCNACHSTDGTKIVGPSYLGIFGESVTVTTAGKERTFKVDEDYIRKSILDPNADVVKGYNKGLMLSYKDQLSNEEIDHIIEYIKSLK